MKCRLLTPEDQVKAVERKLRRRLTAQERRDVVYDTQNYVCAPPGLGRSRRRHVRRRT